MLLVFLLGLDGFRPPVEEFVHQPIQHFSDDVPAGEFDRREEHADVCVLDEDLSSQFLDLERRLAANERGNPLLEHVDGRPRRE